jgi:prophage tail gpP-like protein
MTGRVKDVEPQAEADSSSVGVTVYSLAYDLTEVCAPPELLPLEFNGFDLRQIADRLVAPTLGIATVFDGAPGAKFTRIRCEPGGVIHSFLVDLAQQRGYVLADNASGDLVFRNEAFKGAPVARLEGQPVTKVTANIAAGSWFSTITGRVSKKAGSDGSRFTQRNPLYQADNPRSYTLSVGDTESADVPKAVTAAIGRMVASVVTYTVDSLPTWRDPQGKLWRPNTTVTLLAPEAMVYTETELLIRSVRLHQTAEAETASLELVLPGTFGGFLPTELPWVS